MDLTTSDETQVFSQSIPIGFYTSFEEQVCTSGLGTVSQIYV